ncbi:hypothetical protein IPG41_01135 [Candidatus Peregrinibacteria bacterium]|nr:MAG: hypothetical protein IPG41_01135 [Candidatus Peregrinibacteria bacterium]
MTLNHVPDPEQRYNGFVDGSYHVLANVPPQYVENLQEEAYDLLEFPSLEVSYLMMSREGVFANSNLREAVWHALSTDYASSFGGGFLEDTDQYAARGIFGYLPESPARETDLLVAQRFRDLVPGEVSVILDLPVGLEVLGEAIAQDLSQIDVEVTVNVLNPQDLEEKIQAAQSEFYFFGWKYELADVADFYESVVHSQEGAYGEFNGLAYADPALDEWIETAATSLSPEERRSVLNAVSQRLLEDKNMIPLFEAKTLYGFQPGLYWKLRLDGQLWASEIIETVL